MHSGGRHAAGAAALRGAVCVMGRGGSGWLFDLGLTYVSCLLGLRNSPCTSRSVSCIVRVQKSIERPARQRAPQTRHRVNTFQLGGAA